MLSLQFIIFLLAFLAVVGSELRTSSLWTIAMVTLASLTTAGYPILYDDLLALRWYAWLVVGARNTLLVGMTVWLYWNWLGRWSYGSHQGESRIVGEAQRRDALGPS
jgi:hypothetical protein